MLYIFKTFVSLCRPQDFLQENKWLYIRIEINWLAAMRCSRRLFVSSISSFYTSATIFRYSFFVDKKKSKIELQILRPSIPRAEYISDTRYRRAIIATRANNTIRLYRIETNFSHFCSRLRKICIVARFN